MARQTVTISLNELLDALQKPTLARRVSALTQYLFELDLEVEWVS